MLSTNNHPQMNKPNNLMNNKLNNWKTCNNNTTWIQIYPNSTLKTNKPIRNPITTRHRIPNFGGTCFSHQVILLTYNLVLTTTGAFCSGMGVGFCNIDKLQLEVMTMSNDPNEQKMAKTIHEVVSNHHLWLVTLLVYNAIALESLPLVVHTLMPDWLAIIVSTMVVLIVA